MRVESMEAFEALSIYMKGYAVYMLGARDDEPHVPKHYKPETCNRSEYNRGQNAAMFDVQEAGA